MHSLASNACITASWLLFFQGCLSSADLNRGTWLQSKAQSEPSHGADKSNGIHSQPALASKWVLIFPPWAWTVFKEVYCCEVGVLCLSCLGLPCFQLNIFFIINYPVSYCLDKLINFLLNVKSNSPLCHISNFLIHWANCPNLNQSGFWWYHTYNTEKLTI